MEDSFANSTWIGTNVLPVILTPRNNMPALLFYGFMIMLPALLLIIEILNLKYLDEERDIESRSQVILGDTVSLWADMTYYKPTCSSRQFISKRKKIIFSTKMEAVQISCVRKSQIVSIHRVSYILKLLTN